MNELGNNSLNKNGKSRIVQDLSRLQAAILISVFRDRIKITKVPTEGVAMRVSMSLSRGLDAEEMCDQNRKCCK